MTDNFNLQRFIDAQNNNDTYGTAMAELRHGRKRSHWIWFIFPQIAGLGSSLMSRIYAITCLDEARAYLGDPILGPRLHEACRELMRQVAERGAKPSEILGGIDAIKVRSCLTLFDTAAPDGIFAQALTACYGGVRDNNTLQIINKQATAK